MVSSKYAARTIHAIDFMRGGLCTTTDVMSVASKLSTEAIRGVCGVAKQKVGMSLARKYAQFLHGVYTEMHACLLHGQPLRMRAHSHEP